MKKRQIKILLIEDNPGDVRLIQEMLSEAPDIMPKIECVDRLDAGLKRLAKEGIDLILLDLGLPDSQGFDTFIKVHTQAGEAPIVVLTGLDDEETGLTAVKNGAQDYLVKGHTDGRLLAASIRYAIERKQAEQQLKALNETLEQRVMERTAIATHRAAQLQALAAKLTRTEHRERRRLAQILHDHLQQLLYAARLHLQTLRRGDLKQPQSQDAIDRIDAFLDECIAEARTLTVQLCPPVLHEGCAYYTQILDGRKSLVNWPLGRWRNSPPSGCAVPRFAL